MRSVGVNTNVPATKGPAELNHHNRDELKEVRDGGAFNGHGLSEEDESRINEDVNGGRRMDLVQSQDALRRQHQQPQGPVVQWERFLPIRSLKVLLVENDDSTRHVVSALLRNCSYEVTAVANGLEAWKALLDPDKQIDLVLTEVAMPYLSGIGLLSKIVNHMSCKNIPVIMMSSDDSMGIVFNCLSKGAVDFLVKPIRKNELKNLWQHVWRKCHSSSGSGSESGIRTHISPKSRSNEESDDDAESSDEDEDRSIGLTAKDGSDNGSGTQSSWSKRAGEVNSSQAKPLLDQFADPPDSTCAHVIHARPETFNYWPSMTTTKEQDKEDDAAAMGKDLEIGVPRNSGLTVGDRKKEGKEKLSELISTKASKKLDIGSLDLGCKNGDLRTEVNATVVATKRSNAGTKAGAKEVSNFLKNIDIKDNTMCYTKESPALELSLKRPRDGEDEETSTQERNVLRHSDLSAFSRYNTTSNPNQTPTGNVGSCSPLDISSEAAKPENKQSNSNGIPHQRSNGSSNNDDMGSTTNNAFTKPEADNIAIPNKSTNNVHPASAFQSVNPDHTSALQPAVPKTLDGHIVQKSLTQSRASQQQVQVRHHHHHYHHHHHHVHNLQQQQITNHEDASLRNMESNVLTASTEGNAANYGSASGSNNKSNEENGSSGRDGSSFAAIADGGKMGSDVNGVAEKCEAGDGSGSGSGSGRGSGLDQERVAQREAALIKFRQKRKERCFEKKVRYQSRKKLAEQRPRVRGQFVRQGVNENKSEDADS